MPVGIDLAPEGLKVRAAILHGQDFRLDLLDLLAQLDFLVDIGDELRLDRTADGFRFLKNLLIDFGDLLLDFLHGRIFRREDLELLLILRTQVRPAFLQFLDNQALQDIPGVLLTVFEHLLIVGFGLHALGFGLGQFGIHLFQVFNQDFHTVVQIDDPAFPGIGHEFLFRIFQIGAYLLDLILEKFLGIGRGLVAALQVHADEILRHRIDHRGRLLRAWTLVMDMDKAGILDRRDRQVLEKQFGKIRFHFLFGGIRPAQ